MHPHHVNPITLIRLLLLVLALLSFLRAQVAIPSRINWVALGLAFWMMTLILRGLVPGAPIVI